MTCPYGSGWLSTLLLVRGCLHVLTLQQYHSLRLPWKTRNRFNQPFTLVMFACGGKQPVDFGSVLINIYCCFQVKKRKNICRPILSHCFVFVLFFQLLPPNAFMFPAADSHTCYWTQLVMIVVCGFIFWRTAGRLKHMTPWIFWRH